MFQTSQSRQQFLEYAKQKRQRLEAKEKRDKELIEKAKLLTKTGSRFKKLVCSKCSDNIPQHFYQFGKQPFKNTPQETSLCLNCWAVKNLEDNNISTTRTSLMSIQVPESIKGNNNGSKPIRRFRIKKIKKSRFQSGVVTKIVENDPKQLHDSRMIESTRSIQSVPSAQVQFNAIQKSSSWSDEE